MSAALVTVALCTHNHAERLPRTLEALGRLRQPDGLWELVIVDNGSTDHTADVLRQTTWRPTGVRVRVEREEQIGLSNARNRAIDVANGEYLLFIDDDETPDPEWLAAHTRMALALKPDAFGGPIDVLFLDGVRPAWLQDDLLGFVGRLDYGREHRWLIAPDTPIFGGNFGFKRTVFEKIGRFDTALGRRGAVNVGGEDIEIYERLRRAGCRVLWVPDALIHHRIQATKLRRGYFLDLHFQHGRVEGRRVRGNCSKIPPRHLWGQLVRAARTAAGQIAKRGRDASLRKEMNVAYFVGYLLGWAVDR
jgi:glycosyltransferase involved in cell wall biosynthesis